MASPIVAGITALLYAADPDATSTQIKEALYHTASNYPNKTLSTAYGEVNAGNAVEYMLYGTVLTDIDTSSWYVLGGYLTYAAQNNIMKGYAGTTLFGPESNISRGQVATTMYRMACLSNSSLVSTYGSTTDSNNYATTAVFNDEATGTYYTAAINWAHAVGIMTGDSSTNYTTVRPNDTSTREEIAVMAYRYGIHVKNLNINPSTLPTPTVTDWNLVDSWASDAMKWTCEQNIIGLFDNGNGTYSTLATSTTTRAQMAKVLTRLSTAQAS